MKQDEKGKKKVVAFAIMVYKEREGPGRGEGEITSGLTNLVEIPRCDD